MMDKTNKTNIEVTFFFCVTLLLYFVTFRYMEKRHDYDIILDFKINVGKETQAYAVPKFSQPTTLRSSGYCAVSLALG